MYTDRHGFVQRRQHHGQRPHAHVKLVAHALHVSNVFSPLLDIAIAHPPELQLSVGGSVISPTWTLTAPDERSPIALGRPHNTRSRRIRGRIRDCNFIGTLSTSNLNTCSIAAVRAGALLHLMQAHCIGVMNVQVL